jgi:hypothetical protein
MKSRTARFAFLATTAFLICSCSKQQGQEESREQAGTPDVSPTAAPGVAWRYAYDFQLPDDAIEKVQETHASECEALGIASCRITGLRYSVSDDNAVSAMLEVKLAPSIARQFGKRAAGDVRSAGGRLSSTEFTGEDTGPALSEASRSQADLQTHIADVQKSLTNADLKGSERSQLQSQLRELKSQLAETQSAAAQTQEKLASTPMTFNYYGKGGITGFGGRNPVFDAARSFVASLVTMITLLLQVLAVLLPWVILIGLLVFVVRSKAGRAIGRFFARSFRAEAGGE